MAAAAGPRLEPFIGRPDNVRAAASEPDRGAWFEPAAIHHDHDAVAGRGRSLRASEWDFYAMDCQGGQYEQAQSPLESHRHPLGPRDHSSRRPSHKVLFDKPTLRSIVAGLNSL